MGKIKAYKAFDKDFKCRDFQFEVGKTYTHKGRVSICENGFHSCKNPLECLSYYDLCDSRFAEVTISGTTDTHGQDSKIASAKITIETELKFPEFIKKSVEYLLKTCTGKHSSKQAASGYSSQQAASGDYSKQAASGDYSQQAVSGYSSKQAASGDYSQQAASGDYSQQAVSGDSSKQAVSGDSSKQAASGDSCISMSCGAESQAKTGKHGCIVLSRWDNKEKRYRVSVGYEGENIKKDTWYKLDDNGNFIEV